MTLLDRVRQVGASIVPQSVRGALVGAPTNGGNGHGPDTMRSPALFAGGLDTTITDEGSWSLIAGGGPADRPWYELAQDMTDALDAWRKNFLIRQIVRLTTAYVVGDGVKIVSDQSAFQTFIDDFWNHRQNRLSRRLPAWCDELTRSGELFLVLFPNPVDGMCYVRAIPARCIEQVETDTEDYEKTSYILSRGKLTDFEGKGPTIDNTSTSVLRIGISKPKKGGYGIIGPMTYVPTSTRKDLERGAGRSS